MITDPLEFWIYIVITLFFTITFIISLIRDWEEYIKFISIAVVVIFGIITLLGIGTGNTQGYEEILIKNVEVTKSKSVIYVRDVESCYTKEFTLHKSFLEINDSTKFYYHRSYNLYNGDLHKYMFYRNEKIIEPIRKEKLNDIKRLDFNHSSYTK